MKLFYSKDYVASAEAFDTTRKAGWIARSLRSDPVEGVELCEPHPLNYDDLMEVHRPEYVDALLTGKPYWLAGSSGFAWDKDTWRRVCSSNGGVVDACHVAMRDGVAGSLSSGLHHAGRSGGGGFCTLNGLALGARAALNAGARRVLIVDFDAHCGGGTESMLKPGMKMVDVSTSQFDNYKSSGDARLRVVEATPRCVAKWTRNNRPGLIGDRYLMTCKFALAEVTGDVDLVIYNAGMDPFELCDIGGRWGISYEVLEARERMVFEWAAERGDPVACVLAGGYTGRRLSEGDLVLLHRLTIEAAARSQRRNDGDDDRGGEIVVPQVRVGLDDVRPVDAGAGRGVPSVREGKRPDGLGELEPVPPYLPGRVGKGGTSITR